jgi:hypothetical protein
MQARTTVSEAIEPLRDVGDYNVAPHCRFVYRTAFFHGFGPRGYLRSPQVSAFGYARQRQQLHLHASASAARDEVH